MRFLFLVTLGPVQDFISSARRTRDLHFGSWFLSELSRAAAREIYEQQEYLIFPAPEDKDWLKPENHFNVANRILASIEQPPKELAEHVHKAVFRRLDDIRKKAYTDIHLPSEQQANAEAQIKDLVELVWVALPFPDEKDYHTVRGQLELLLAARKNTYAFQPVGKWSANVPKSSLDGHLESVIPEKEYPTRKASGSEKQQALQRLYDRYKVGGLGERLSGVDLLKRSGQTAFDIHFPSTSHIATLSLLQRMTHLNKAGRLTLRSAWNTYVTRLGTLAAIPIKEQFTHSYIDHPILGRYDGSLLFEGRLVDILLLPSTDAANNEKFRQARQEQQIFYDSLDEQFNVFPGKKRPSPYYALLQADGDNMGELIDALAEKENGREWHRTLSQALSRFAKNVRTIVNGDKLEEGQGQGALIYSGGDDVLAFLPLHTVLQCAIKLKQLFHDELKGLAEEAGCRTPTLSIGIAIVHHLESLREARRLAHNAEKQAKSVDGKNALAITMSKRSGEDYHVVGSWGNIDKRLLQLINYCRAADLPVGMAYELRDLVLRLSVAKDDERYETLQHVIRVDTLRILLRKLTVPANKLPPKRVQEIESFLRDQLNLPPKGQEGKEEDILQDTGQGEEKRAALVSAETFINELVIAQMLAEAAELALV